MNRQQGFGAIAAIVILVILAVLASAIVSIGGVQQVSSAQDVMSAKAWQAARAGDEWGLYQALKNGSCVATPAQTLDLSADTGFRVTVTCDSWTYNEGETIPGTPRQVVVYRITAVACPAAACPPDMAVPANKAVVAGAGYIERTRVVLATN